MLHHGSCHCGRIRYEVEGIHPYGEGVGPGGAKMAAINLRTLENFDLDSVPVKHFDGRSV